MARIKINDRDLEVKDGATILEAALQNGIDIPYMCYHPAMKVVAVCRICQVEVKGMPKLQTACSTPVRDGMEVLTESPAARKARAGTVEFWLLNHPLDCPICDKGGECPLQDVTYNLRGGGSRLRDPKVHRPKRKVLGPHIIFDAERCIICWRCTRFTQDISGSDQLMLTARGVKTEIDTPPGVELTDPFSGNLADVCPVGALTTRDFRFKSRPWEMTAVESTCTACPVGCSMTLWSKRGVIQRMTARPNSAVNDYWLCDRGRFDLAFVNAPERLQKPAGTVSPAADRSLSWDEAAGALAGLVRGAGEVAATGSWAVAASPHATNEEYFALQRFARGTLGTNDLVLDTGRGGPELTAARVEWLKGGRLLESVADLDAADLIVQVGQNLEASHPVYSLRIRKAVRDRGARLYIGSTAPGGLDREALLRAAVEPGQEAGFLERLASGAGNDPLHLLKDAVSQACRGVVVLNAGPGNEALLAAVRPLFDLNRDGLKLLLLDDGSNVTGAWDAGFAAGYLPGYAPVNETAAAALRTDWGGAVPGRPGRGRAEALAAVGRGEIAGLVLFNSGRPWNWSDDVRAAAEKARTLIVFDLTPSELQARAALALPAPSMAELDGTVTAPDHRVLLVRRAVPGPDGLWHPAQFLARVERLAGGSRRSGSPVDVFRDLTRAGAGYEGLNFGLLRPEGRPWRPAWRGATSTVGGGAAE